MEINFLKNEYDKDTEKLYQDFKSGQVNINSDYVTDTTVYLTDVPNFPIYLPNNYGTEENFKVAIKTLKKYYISTDRDVHMNGRFWHSLLTIYKRDYIVEKYPEVLESKGKFENIVLKKFDWENYIYKCVLAAEYISDSDFSEKEENEFISTVVNNLDVYNYIIKYKLFRNRQFVVNFLTMIQENDLSNIMKKRIKNHHELGGDERYGRRVVFELNKSYPVLMAPFMDKNELLNKSLEILQQYGADVESLDKQEILF
ncbi:DUF6339 family protein [Enterococcus hirae]|nr:DUF6339 family protein [Enterococcus hirae]